MSNQSNHRTTNVGGANVSSSLAPSADAGLCVGKIFKLERDMELSNRENDLLEALSGTAKSALSIIPGLGQAIAGWESYKRSGFDRNLLNVIKQLQEKTGSLGTLFSQEWIKTEEGQQFSRKVFDSAFDTQLEDKQELFVNALINGINDDQTEYLEKLKFVDMLRNLSRASLMVLADMHKMFINKVKGPDRVADSISPLPRVDSNSIAQELSTKYHPYLITSAISEMESQGLFSNVGGIGGRSLH